MKYLTFPFLLLLLPLIGFGCSSEEKETDSLILFSDSEIFFEQGIDFAATSGTRNLSFSSGRPWRISLTTDTDTRRAADWCTVSPSSGTAGDASVTISIQENADYDSRSVKLTLVAGGIEKSFTVSQKQKDALTLTASRFEVGKEGGTVQVEVKANITFEVEIPEVDRSWISQANTRGLVVTNLAFTVAPNEGVAGREGEIVIRSGSLSEKIRITQEGRCDDGLSFRPETPDADRQLTLYFKATKTSPLYGYAGDVYVHTGVVSEGTWMYVPEEWNTNVDKCKMVRVADNIWSITLAPSIRQWFGSNETPVRQLGVVIRSADGSKKGTDGDSFVSVTDHLYKPFEPAAVRYASMPGGLQEGINLIDASTVTLVLYDKDKKGGHKDFAHVVGDFNDWKLSNESNSQMNRDDAAGCWWITLTGLQPTREYAFQYYVGTRAGEILRLADAYSRKILDPDNDKYIPSSTYPDAKEYPTGAVGIASVFKIQGDSYDWKVKNFRIPDKNNLMIYELLLRDFTATGDLNGAMEKIGYLKSLGFNAVELMPVQEFDGNDSWGYNPCFYFALDKAYGTDHMYKAFIDKCHEAGMAVLFDVVYNHASGSHPFARLYWDTKNNRTAADNPWFNVKEPHPYGVFHDFNHDSPLVRAFVKRNLKFLLEEYRIDGFRFDMTKGFTQNSSTEATAGNYDASRIAILKDYNETVREVNPEAVVILEHFCDEKEESELAEEGMQLWRNLNNAYCQSAMGYPSNSDFTPLVTFGTTMPYGGWVGFMESHDEERTAFKQIAYGEGPLKSDINVRMKQLAANASFFFTAPGPKMVWQFGEMGYDVSIEEGGRTGRKPLHWEYLDNEARKGLCNTYAKLLKLRREHSELFNPGSTFSWLVKTANWTGGRFLTLAATNGKRLVVVGNFTAKPIEAITSFPVTGVWTNYLDGTKLHVTSIPTGLTIPAHECRVYINF